MFRVLTCLVCLVALAGCQIDVSGAAGVKAFYPNKWKEGGDPRQGMYNGSGYGEAYSSGGASNFAPGFSGMSATKPEVK